VKKTFLGIGLGLLAPCLPLAGGGIFLMLVWTGHLTDLTLVASSVRADDPNLGSLQQFLLTIKWLSFLSLIASFVFLMGGLSVLIVSEWKLQKAKHV
jgi:hypothetical protein